MNIVALHTSITFRCFDQEPLGSVSGRNAYCSELADTLLLICISGPKISPHRSRLAPIFQHKLGSAESGCPHGPLPRLPESSEGVGWGEGKITRESKHEEQRRRVKGKLADVVTIRRLEYTKQCILPCLPMHTRSQLSK